MKKKIIKNNFKFLLTIVIISVLFAISFIFISNQKLFSDHVEQLDYDIDPGPAFAIEAAEPFTAAAPKTYPTYLEAYFSGLTTNMGENYKNSCGYVAMGMLLSYYDSFLNDNIIPEDYDAVSKGDSTNMKGDSTNIEKYPKTVAKISFRTS